MGIFTFSFFNVEIFPNFCVLVLYLVLLFLAGIIGFLASLILGSIILFPIYLWRAKLNGAPFKANDEVQIITGPHHGRIGRIYEIWSDRKEVRVWLGPKESEELKDVFAYIEIFEVKS